MPGSSAEHAATVRSVSTRAGIGVCRPACRRSARASWLPQELFDTRRDHRPPVRAPPVPQQRGQDPGPRPLAHGPHQYLVDRRVRQPDQRTQHRVGVGHGLVGQRAPRQRDGRGSGGCLFEDEITHRDTQRKRSLRRSPQRPPHPPARAARPTRRPAPRNAKRRSVLRPRWLPPEGHDAASRRGRRRAPHVRAGTSEPDSAPGLISPGRCPAAPGRPAPAPHAPRSAAPASPGGRPRARAPWSAPRRGSA